MKRVLAVRIRKCALRIVRGKPASEWKAHTNLMITHVDKTHRDGVIPQCLTYDLSKLSKKQKRFFREDKDTTSLLQNKLLSLEYSNDLTKAINKCTIGVIQTTNLLTELKLRTQLPITVSWDKTYLDKKELDTQT